MSEEWNPKPPDLWRGEANCVICGEKITAPPFIASKPKRGATIYAHTRCFTKEQKVLKEAQKQ